MLPRRSQFPALALAEIALDHAGIACLPAYSAKRHLDEGGQNRYWRSMLHRLGHFLRPPWYQDPRGNPAVCVFVEFLRRNSKHGALWHKTRPPSEIHPVKPALFESLAMRLTV